MGNARRALLVLLAAVGFVLADRLREHREPPAGARQFAAKEIAVRTAGRRAPARVRQFLAEGLVLSLVGGAVGCCWRNGASS